MIAAAIDRLAQPADVHVDQVALRVEVQVPYTLEQHGARHHLSRAAHEELEQLHLPRREIELTAAARHPPLEQVELEILDLQARAVCGARRSNASMRASSSANAKGLVR